jgi:hypothetical protein
MFFAIFAVKSFWAEELLTAKVAKKGREGRQGSNHLVSAVAILRNKEGTE